MRRFFLWLLISLMLCAACAGAEANPYDAILAEVDAFGADAVEFMTAEGWLSVRFTREMVVVPVGQVTQHDGRAYDLTTGETIAWEDLFVDGDLAAERLEGLAENALYDNAYAEYKEVTPVPRDSFTVANGLLTLYYPASQLSYFSGSSGALSFYAYELAGLLQEGVPLAVGDPATAKEGLETALETGTLPGALSEWAIGVAMRAADEALYAVDTPDIKEDYAVYHFEAPEMRGVGLLADPASLSVESAGIVGIWAERIDFHGLCAGVATREQCVEALGQPDRTTVIEAASAYSRLPAGETLGWQGHGNVLELHFVEGVLQSVTLRETTEE